MGGWGARNLVSTHPREIKIHSRINGRPWYFVSLFSSFSVIDNLNEEGNETIATKIIPRITESDSDAPFSFEIVQINSNDGNMATVRKNTKTEKTR